MRATETEQKANTSDSREAGFMRTPHFKGSVKMEQTELQGSVRR